MTPWHISVRVRPVKGKPAHTVSWQGATWQFADAETRAAFESAPEDFAPQYGGYCAYALSKNAIAKTEPDAWTINNGKLYLNYDTSVRALWQRDIPGQCCAGQCQLAFCSEQLTGSGAAGMTSDGQ